MSQHLEDDAKSAFSNPSTMASKRLGNRVGSLAQSVSPSEGGSVRSSLSRRSASLITSAEDAMLFDQMSVTTGVRVASPKNKNKVIPQKPKTKVDEIIANAEGFIRSLSPTSDTEAQYAEENEETANETSSAFSFDDQDSRKSRLDFIYNDNNFLVIAELLVDFFEEKTNGDKMIVLKAGDGEEVDRIVPESARLKFIEAVRFRLENPPKESRTPAFFLALQCKKLGLDKFGSKNPIVAAHATTSDEDVILPLGSDEEEASSTSSASHSDSDTEGAEEGQVGIKIPLASVEEDVDRGDSSKGTGDSSLNNLEETGEVNISRRDQIEPTETTDDADTSPTKQQLQAELRQAKKLRENSVSAETSLFWGNQVKDLEQRIEELSTNVGETVAVLPQSTYLPERRSADPPQVLPVTHTSPVDIAENNRRLLSEFQHREQNSIPDVCPSQSSVSSNHVSEAEYGAPMVDVVSPADLPGGYHFEAEIEGQRFLATVPPGGVQQGETFTCYMRELDSVAIDIPVGHWKDGPQDVFKYGCCHPVVWNSIFCPLIQLSQIQTRVNLDFLGRPKTTVTEMSNRSMMLIVVAFWLVVNFGLFMGYHIKWSRGVDLSVADYAAVVLINLAFVGFVIFITQSTRSSIRESFLIREERCYDLEDLSCSALCLPCTLAQMSRHTANYDDYEAVCCSKSGLPDGVRVNQAPIKPSGSYVV